METPSERTRRWSPLPPARLAVLLGLSLFVILVDQASKALVRANLDRGDTWPEGWELIRISHVHNSGAAFGILQDAGAFLVIAPLIAIAAITVALLALAAHNRWYSVALAAILGGAIGNLIDRLRLGYVTDFIDPMRYPSFNIADSAIVLGVITILVLTFLAPTDDETDGEPEADTEGARTPRSVSADGEVRS